MENNKHLYEPVINFRKNKPQMQIKNIEQDELYEKAFFPEKELSQSEYTLNTTTWD